VRTPPLLLLLLLLLLLSGCVQLDVALEGGVDPGLQPLPGGLPMTFDRVGVPLVGYHAAHLPRAEALRRFGVTLVDARPLGAMAPDNARAHPIVVAALERGSPLAHKGVRPFDAIAAIDSKPATELADVAARLAGAAPGDVLALAIVRPGGEALTVEVEASEHALEYDQTKLPLLFEHQGSSGGWSLGLGPLDLLLGARHAVEHWAAPPPASALPRPGAPPGPPEPPALGEVRESRSRFRDRVQWGVLWGLVGWERETELPAGETRSRLRLFWLFTAGDDPLEQEQAQGGGA
jgi:hypothetical protein